MTPSIYQPAALLGKKRLRISSPTTSYLCIHIHIQSPHHAPIQRRLQSTSTTSSSSSSSSSPPPRLAKRKPEPLRILFCGTDHFSCASLSALHDLHKANPDLVESIDVLVRPGKPSGRGRKRATPVPLFNFAESLGLPIHQRDTFTGWELPLPGRVTHPKTGVKKIFPHPSGQWTHRPYGTFNLIIAVSFGLFVPPRILSALRYGGLNIHPSLLPDLRGPAPLQWTILAGRTHTGVTLQTLHPTEFDCGRVLAQTAAPGIPVSDDATSLDLLNLLAPEGGRILVEALRQKLHVPPYGEPLALEAGNDEMAAAAAAAAAAAEGERENGQSPQPPLSPATPVLPSPLGPSDLRDAPKIKKGDSLVDWRCQVWGTDKELYPTGRLTAGDLVRRRRAVGVKIAGVSHPGLWTHAVTPGNPEERRLILEDLEAIECPDLLLSVCAMIMRMHHAMQVEPPADQTKDDWKAQTLKNVWKDGLSLESRSRWPDTRPDIPWWAHKPEIKIPENIVNIVFTTLKDAQLKIEHEDVRLPVLIEDEEVPGRGASIVIPIGLLYNTLGDKVVFSSRPHLDAIRIRNVKVEGLESKPASHALGKFMEKGLIKEDLINLSYAVDVMGRLADEV